MVPFVVALWIIFLAATKSVEIHDELVEKPSITRHLRSLENPNLKIHNASITGPRLFQSIVQKQVKYSDKIEEHKYAEMYGTFLFPYLRHAHQNGNHVKFLEIGLGCDKNMPGWTEARSVKVWKGILGEHDDLWIAEFNEECVEKAKANHLLDNVHTLVGDQSNREVLKSWVTTSGGQFDIVVDDGGHFQHHIFNSFMELWPQVKPGGLYFIEDLQVAREFIATESDVPESIMNFIYNWQEYLVTGRVLGEQTEANLAKYKPPSGIRWIVCQAEACLIAKCDEMSGQVTRCT